MKLLELEDVKYQVLHACALDNVDAAKKNRVYDKLVKNDKQKLYYFLDIIQEAEFTELEEKNEVSNQDSIKNTSS